MTQNITTFPILPATITAQEKADYEIKHCKLTDIMDSEGNLTNPATIGHSRYVDHPDNGTSIYAIDNLFNEKLTQAEKDSCLPSVNFASATDDKYYTPTEVRASGFYPDNLEGI